MRVAILGDVHGNLNALQRVVADAREQGVDRFACIGDIVGYNPDPNGCVEFLQNIGCVCVRGNHDHLCAHPDTHDDLSALAAAAVAWTRLELTDPCRAFLQELPFKGTVEGFTIVHNTLHNTPDWEYVFDAEDAELSIRHQDTQVCFHGHTHIPVAFEYTSHVALRLYGTVRVVPGTVYFVNVGSVGQPRDRDPRAAYAVFDLERGEITLRRVVYDIAGTQKSIMDAKLPDWLATRLAYGI